MIADDYYRNVDLKVYREIVAPLLGERVLDIHTHARLQVAPQPHRMPNKYPGRSVDTFPVEELDSTLGLFFPDQTIEALVFGMPFPEEYAGSNQHVIEGCARRDGFYPLYIPDMDATEDQVRQIVTDNRVLGFKPYWRMVSQTESEVSIADMLPEPYMRAADEWGLIIMLHIPGQGRLAGEENIQGIQSLSKAYPNAKIIIAHLGRSYCPWSIRKIDRLIDLPNVYWDTSFVQEAMVYKIFFDHVDPQKVFYGTDLPLAATRGRRVCVNGRWVDVSRDPLSWTAHRDEAHRIEATFMAYEMIRALWDGAEAAGLREEQIKPIFYENGKRLIDEVVATLKSIT